MYRRIERPQPRQHGYEITSKLTRDEVRTLAHELDTTIAAEGPIRVLIDLQSAPYADVGAFWEDLKFGLRNMDGFERVALVGDSAWQKAAMKVFDALSPASCRYFERGQTARAWSWLDE